MTGTTQHAGTSARATALTYIQPAGRRATQYEELTLHMQWSPDNYAAQGWFNLDCSGAPPWRPDATLFKARDWWAFRDPAGEWYRPFIDRQLAIGQAIKHAVAGERRATGFAGIDPRWIGFLGQDYGAYRFAEYGAFLALCQAQRECASDVIAQPIIFQSFEKDRHAQDIALFGLEIEECLPGFSDAGCKDVWLASPAWQPLRKLVELLLAARDWGEIHLVLNLMMEGLVAPLFTRELVMKGGSRNGDFVSPIIAAGAESDRAIRRAGIVALVEFLLEQDPGNRVVINGLLGRWSPLVDDAVRGLEPVFTDVGLSFSDALAAVTAEQTALLDRLGLDVEARIAA